MDEPVFVVTTTTQAVEVADATVGYIDGATPWLASNAAATIAPHISTLVVNNGEGSATSKSEANAATQVEPSQQSESELQPEPEQVTPPFVGQTSDLGGWPFGTLSTRPGLPTSVLHHKG